LFTTIDRYANAVRVSEATACRRLKGIPFRVPTRGRGIQWYPLGAAVQTLREKEMGAIEGLTRTARDLDAGDLYIEAPAISIAESFIGWTTGAARDRLRAAQNGFVVAVSNSRICSPAIVRNLDPLRTLFVLNPDVTRWILLGGTPPNVDALAPSFAVVNNGPALAEYHANLELVA